jgi:hypothetical protein
MSVRILQFSPVIVIPPIFHIHSSYHRRYMMGVINIVVKYDNEKGGNWLSSFFVATVIYNAGRYMYNESVKYIIVC